MTRRIDLYGRLRDTGHGDHVLLALPEKATARQALAALREKLAGSGALLKGCALATEEDVLSPDERIPKNGRLAALPPVCGG